MMSGIFGNGDAARPLDVAAFLDSGITQRVAQLVSMGCLVGIGSSRDGGALSISVLYNGESTREWFRDTETAELFLEHSRQCVEVAGGIERRADPEPRPVARRGRSRPR